MNPPSLSKAATRRGAPAAILSPAVCARGLDAPAPPEGAIVRSWQRGPAPPRPHSLCPGQHNRPRQRKERDRLAASPLQKLEKSSPEKESFSFNFVLLPSAAAQYGCPDTLPLQRSGGLPFQSRKSGCFQTRKRFWLPCTGARKNTGPRRWYPAHRRRHIPR